MRKSNEAAKSSGCGGERVRLAALFLFEGKRADEHRYFERRVVTGARWTYELREWSATALNVNFAIWGDCRDRVRIDQDEGVVVGWVELSLNPHPFKTKRVRHPNAGYG